MCVRVGPLRFFFNFGSLSPVYRYYYHLCYYYYPKLLLLEK